MRVRSRYPTRDVIRLSGLLSQIPAIFVDYFPDSLSFHHHSPFIGTTTMAGTKRAAAEESGATTRASKAAKTDASATPAKPKRGGKKAAKAALPASAFKAKAPTLHATISHTAPDGSPNDPGFLANFALTASSFSTGSYGWKGNKRFTVEISNPEGGEKENVQVQLSINATVVGSKGAKEGEEETKEEDQPTEEAPAAEEDAKPAEATETEEKQD
ncbi:hypothetical protein BDN72DRAFT_959431 [Pluteus cervinus]|uniref:Uncharacterized protein n=1 Tax=Pluteus cervinus TaxID=181527 RepID=A0ACD3AUI6_9AGAR|nr:hypothetical protein BDN72DRAFT_959431 [Pluteus cervinus]